MYVRPRPRFRPRNAGGVAFSPALLFTSGVAGAWYDPSDYSTLFQDSAGTTPVTAVEQPVGLMLDKSQGLVLGSELVTNGDFSSGTTGWTLGAGWTVSSNALAINQVGSAIGASQTFSITAGKAYVFEFDVTSYTSGVLAFGTKTGSSVEFGQTSAVGHVKRIGFAGASNDGIRFYSTGAGFVGTIDNISVKELPGNHASQATAASRPVLRARYNLLTYSEQFDNAVWTKAQTTISANAVTAPDGTTTADKMVETAVTNVHGAYQTFTYVSGATYSASVYAKQAERSWIYLGADTAAAEAVFFDLANGTVGAQGTGYVGSIQSVGDGWYRCTVTITQSTALPPNYFVVGVTTANNTTSYLGDITKGVYLWGADLRTGFSAGTYQRIAAATDYATAGFLPYLALDGTDDSFATNSIDFSATDKMSVCAGVTKLNAAATFGVVAELTANWNTNAGSFYIGVEDAAYRYASGARGNAATSIDQVAKTTDAAYASPSTNVLTTTHDIAASQSVLRLNAAAINTATGAKGSGNFSNAPLYIGRRGGASAPLNGRIYQLIVCGKALSASELASTEAYVNSKTGAY